jgi:hypothetical protein
MCTSRNTPRWSTNNHRLAKPSSPRIPPAKTRLIHVLRVFGAREGGNGTGPDTNQASVLLQDAKSAEQRSATTSQDAIDSRPSHCSTTAIDSRPSYRSTASAARHKTDPSRGPEQLGGTSHMSGFDHAYSLHMTCKKFGTNACSSEHYGRGDKKIFVWGMRDYTQLVRGEPPPQWHPQLADSRPPNRSFPDLLFFS